MKKDVVIFISMFLVVLLITLFLPDRIPILFNASGKATLIVNKYYLLLATIIPYSVYWQYFRNKNK
ncbi:uncharacterized protein DUF1648 [Natranaerovirga hydrolytica]|uniref:Uncharacterized protein DUF1648 n=1 Tax=Natranaerovirga hydrolytica TaxID=680378 RepID=A0A4R1MZL1_9FIRM|nr:DUF1648 domain-containing protein [Natranaerovirga hydrolytica]TCK98777.1 uncharacterized protein DUF1648 [Natranaerovirga hydrolytica]